MQKLYMTITVENARDNGPDYADKDKLPITVNKDGVYMIRTIPANLEKMNMDVMCNALVGAAHQILDNSPETIGPGFELHIGVLYPEAPIYRVIGSTSSAIFSLVQVLSQMAVFESGDIIIHPDVNVRGIMEYYLSRRKSEGLIPVNPDDAFEDDDEDLEDDDEDLADYLKAMGYDPDDDDEDKKKHKKGSSGGKRYPRSRVIAASKNPKKQYKRHGVVIYGSKRNAKKDRETIKSFLKDFIPGSSQWKKDFRDDVLDRWMRSFAISKKKLARLEKAHTASRKPKYSLNTDKILDYTNRILSGARNYGDHSSWNNPNM